MPVVGVTGALGSGKSTVVAAFAERGAVVVDADAIGHQMLQRGGPCYDRLRARFGDDIAGEDGAIIRARLGARAFATPADTAALNAITHPALLAELRRQVREADAPGRLVVVDAALLLEWGAPVRLDRIVVITAEEPERIRRMVARTGLDEAEIRRRAARQMSEAEKVQRADFVLPNNDSLDVLRARAGVLWDLLVAELHPHAPDGEG